MIKVVAAVIINEYGEILIGKRAATGKLPNCWEFPGGKIEENETKENALVREINEELGCEIEVGEELANTVHHYPDFSVEITFLKCKLINGTPKTFVHQQLVWVKSSELSNYQFAEANLVVLYKLK